MAVKTRSQEMAQAAFAAVSRSSANEKFQKDYVPLAKKFPALIHSCGLAQAVAFFLSKAKEGSLHRNYLKDLVAVLNAGSHRDLADEYALEQLTRSESLTDYLRLSRDAIAAASWVKRYTEALEKTPCEPEE